MEGCALWRGEGRTFVEGNALTTYTAQKRNGQLRRRYGISLWHYHQMLEDQQGTCAVCKTPPPADRALVVDHDHTTGAVRALLCDRCNRALGFLRDCPRIALGNLMYLLEHKDPE